MVTSTSTPGSMLMEVICFTISLGLCKSITRLWILIWKRSQVLDPSPQGVFLVVILKILVGIRIGPFTRNFCCFAPEIKSVQTGNKNKNCNFIFILRFKIRKENKIKNGETFFQTLHIPRGERDSDAVDKRRLCSGLLRVLVERLQFKFKWVRITN